MVRKLIAVLFAALALNAVAAVDANRATQAELESVKGIGPGLSAKILKAREAASFKDWTDLVDRVGGIGPGNAARFSQAGLTVGGVAYETSSEASLKAASGKPAKAADSSGEAAASKATKKAGKGPQT